MARRKKRPIDARLAAAHRQRLRDELPPGMTLDDMGELCRTVHPNEFAFGCRDGSHSLALANDRIANEFFHFQDEILAWLAEVGGVCDCTIHSRALPRVVRLSQDLWD